MKKLTLTTILLLLLTSISVLANSETKIETNLENSIELIEVDAMTTQLDNIEVLVNNSTDQNLASVIVKHETTKYNSRKARMKTVVNNFLRNPEMKEVTSNVLC